MSAPAIQRKGVFYCGACHCVLVKRTSYLLHPHLRNDVYVCQNPLCSASYSGRTEITGLVSPSGIPNAPACELPPTPACERTIAERALRQQQNDAQLDIFDSPCP